MIDSEKQIREALAAGPTPGPWFSRWHNDGRFLSISPAPYVTVARVSVTNINREANAALIVACNPAAITELLAEIDKLRIDAGRYRHLRNHAIWDTTALESDRGVWCVIGSGHADSEPVEREELDAAVDAAIRARST